MSAIWIQNNHSEEQAPASPQFGFQGQVYVCVWEEYEQGKETQSCLSLVQTVAQRFLE